MADTVASISQKIAELFAKAPGAVGAALYQEGLAVDALAVGMCPVDTGRLRATHYVGPPELRDGSLEVPVGFGTEYALYVHERTDVGLKGDQFGPRKLVKGARQALYGGADGGATGAVGPKFLERALHQRMTGFEERLAKRARRNLRDGVTAAPIDGNVPTSPQDPGPIGAQLGPTRKTLGAMKRAARKARRKAEKTDRAWHSKAKKRELRQARKETKREKRRAAAESKKAAKRLRREQKRQQRQQIKKDRAFRRGMRIRDFDF